jgi:hypothetical protein
LSKSLLDIVTCIIVLSLTKFLVDPTDNKDIEENTDNLKDEDIINRLMIPDVDYLMIDMIGREGNTSKY